MDYYSYILGFLFTMAFYHLMVYTGRRDDRSNLAFGLFFFFFAVSLFIRYVYPRFPFHSRSIESVAYLFGTVFVGYFLTTFANEVFGFKTTRRVTRLYFIVCLPAVVVASTLFLLLSNILFISSSYILICGFALVYFIVLIKNTVTGYSRFNTKQKTVIRGFIMTLAFVLFFLVGNAVNFRMASWITSIIYAALGLSFVYALTTGFNAEHKALEDLNRDLERKVEERTNELNGLFEQKRMFFVNIAHETKTPLTLIRNYLEAYVAKTGESPELSIIRQNVWKLERDMLNYLDLTRLEREGMSFDHGTVINLSALCRLKEILFLEYAEQRRVAITPYVEDGIFVRMDPEAADRILTNLLDNAVKYSRPDTLITLSLKSGDGYANLRIEDQGIGIPPEQLDTIFEPYYQVSHKKRNIQGSGMGLSIIKKIIDSVGGTISVESRINEGTLIRIRFKVCGETAAARTGFKPQRPVSAALPATGMGEVYFEGRKNILVVEDNPQMRTYLFDTLNDAFNVFCASNGKEAMERLQTIPRPNLVLSDIMMDQMDGYAFHEAFSADPGNGDIPFIFLTALASEERKIRGLKMGVIDYITKPFRADEVKSKIASCLKLQVASRDSAIARTEEAISSVLREPDPEQDKGGSH
jgi:signal transduction histidine kinase/CheY-like chemotaxis protein